MDPAQGWMLVALAMFAGIVILFRVVLSAPASVWRELLELPDRPLLSSPRPSRSAGEAIPPAMAPPDVPAPIPPEIFVQADRPLLAEFDLIAWVRRMIAEAVAAGEIREPLEIPSDAVIEEWVRWHGGAVPERLRLFLEVAGLIVKCGNLSTLAGPIERDDDPRENPFVFRERCMIEWFRGHAERDWEAVLPAAWYRGEPLDGLILLELDPFSEVGWVLCQDGEPRVARVGFEAHEGFRLAVYGECDLERWLARMTAEWRAHRRHPSDYRDWLSFMTRCLDSVPAEFARSEGDELPPEKRDALGAWGEEYRLWDRYG